MGFSWESHYEDGDWDRGAYVGGDDMADHLDGFLDHAARGERDPVESLASVGCGPAAAEFAVAERRPDVDVHCYDAAPAVVDANRVKADEEGLENVSFDVAALPDTGIDRTFDVVYCMAVLYFVRDATATLRELWRLTAPGGHLVLTYPNRNMQSWAQGLDETDHDKRDAFSLVAAGENLLSYDRIHDVLGAHPRNYWTAVDADPDAEYVQRTGSPAVYLRKPE
ncbi:class I SAM-dependent methyltransferase [Halorubellus sp. JP-L1]|uniref:class I SAM-dependent methyltransferase n=1 Tax=Halorubellus sp. JP-L1 TaxID=2715753 RepID=UPI00140C03F4|nr:class I SAM-dependent methyltransferase [Halorubellus sp. JP-L1]NHN41743.1 class I SAM-dependent methyltransferase [Halorubellus sp. JP-L1]